MTTAGLRVAVGVDGPAAVVAALRAARHVTAICHENPDADTLGAAIATALIAERLGCSAEVVSADGVAPVVGLLPGAVRVRRRPGLEPDLAVICDAATLERVGRLVDDERAWLARARIVNIDHHVSNTYFGAINHVDPTAAATCQVLAELLPELGIVPDPEMATALLTGIVRDSHGFADASTSPRTLRVAAGLVEAGASLSDVVRRVLHDLPLPSMVLWGRLLDGLRVSADGRIVATLLTAAMLQSTGTAQHDADGVVEFMATGRGVEVAILARDLGGETRISLRTSDAVDATRAAAVYGGGGHRRRAGCTIGLPAEAALAAVIRTVEELLPPT